MCVRTCTKNARSSLSRSNNASLPSRYDLYDIEATPTRDYSTLNGTTLFATPGYCYLKLPLEEAIFEGGRTVRYMYVVYNYI